MFFMLMTVLFSRNVFESELSRHFHKTKPAFCKNEDVLSGRYQHKMGIKIILSIQPLLG